MVSCGSYSVKAPTSILSPNNDSRPKCAETSRASRSDGDVKPSGLPIVTSAMLTEGRNKNHCNRSKSPSPIEIETGTRSSADASKPSVSNPDNTNSIARPVTSMTTK